MSAAVERTPQLQKKYELLEEVGHGGMATVYRAIDRRLEREVAVKVIHRHLRENPEVAARFVSEARAVAKLKHPNIVEVYDVSEESEQERYLIVELVRGRTLRALLTKQKHLPAEIAAAIAIEVAQGLGHAHELGVIHRDVKPENVLLSEPPCLRGRGVEAREPVLAAVKITDFGIAKLLDAQGVTATGQVLGSPAHMAPEQIEGGAVSARADVFGLGVLLYESMVGRLPFDGKNPAQMLRRVLEGVFTPAERCRPTIGAGLGGVVGRALSHVPEDRYASAGQLVDALREQLALVGMSDTRRELTDYLVDPAAYSAEYEQRVTKALVAEGREAREAGDVPAAAALFNRALAFQPDDSELLREVTAIARGQRLRRTVSRGMAVLLGLAVLGGGTWVGLRAFGPDASASPRPGDAAAERAPANAVSAPRPERSGARQPAASEGPAVAATPQGERRVPSRATGDTPHQPAAAPPAARRPAGEAPRATGDDPAEEEAGTRKVRVHISGAAGGTLRIDGVPRDWFGVEQELTLGPHRIEFLPPNEDCCIAPEPKVINVAPGPDVQQVHGHIEFRDAVVHFAGQPGSVLRCGELFPGELVAPAERSVPMSRPRVSARCTAIPPPESGRGPKGIDVTLKPGGTFNISGP